MLRPQPSTQGTRSPSPLPRRPSPPHGPQIQGSQSHSLLLLVAFWTLMLKKKRPVRRLCGQKVNVLYRFFIILVICNIICNIIIYLNFLNILQLQSQGISIRVNLLQVMLVSSTSLCWMQTTRSKGWMREVPPHFLQNRFSLVLFFSLPYWVNLAR